MRYNSFSTRETLQIYFSSRKKFFFKIFFQFEKLKKKFEIFLNLKNKEKTQQAETLYHPDLEGNLKEDFFSKKSFIIS